MATALTELIREVVTTLCMGFDLQGLDGVTVSANYDQALLDLDRGYESKHVLTASKGHGFGIAMSPRVLRDGQLRNHLVFNAHAIYGLLIEKKGNRVINLIAHEFAHVEITHLFNRTFPGLLLGQRMDTIDVFRWDVTLACWDEYAACWKSAKMGPTTLDEYETSFLSSLESARADANAAITEYRLHDDAVRVVNEACVQYWELLKYAAYHLGNLAGHGLTWMDMPKTVEQIEGHWFQPYFIALDAACKDLAETYGDWTPSQFGVIGNLAEDIVAENGLMFYRHGDGDVGINIPMTPETTPGFSQSPVTP